MTLITVQQLQPTCRAGLRSQHAQSGVNEHFKEHSWTFVKETKWIWTVTRLTKIPPASSFPWQSCHGFFPRLAKSPNQNTKSKHQTQPPTSLHSFSWAGRNKTVPTDPFHSNGAVGCQFHATDGRTETWRPGEARDEKLSYLRTIGRTTTLSECLKQTHFAQDVMHFQLNALYSNVGCLTNKPFSTLQCCYMDIQIGILSFTVI